MLNINLIQEFVNHNLVISADAKYKSCAFLTKQDQVKALIQIITF